MMYVCVCVDIPCSATESELSAVIQQLEQDRALASKRARRMKEELKQAQADRDIAVKVVVELKNKLTLVKEASRKEIALLQAKVAKVIGVFIYICTYMCKHSTMYVHVNHAGNNVHVHTLYMYVLLVTDSNWVA